MNCGRNIFFKTFCLLVVIAVIVANNSCTKVCSIGLEGSNCKDTVAQKYYGTFSGSQLCGSAVDTFNIAISPYGNDLSKLNITNIYNAGIYCYGDILPNGSATIPYQTFGNAGYISGDITIEGGKLKLSYLIKLTGLSDAACTWQQK